MFREINHFVVLLAQLTYNSPEQFSRRVSLMRTQSVWLPTISHGFFISIENVISVDRRDFFMFSLKKKSLYFEDK